MHSGNRGVSVPAEGIKRNFDRGYMPNRPPPILTLTGDPYRFRQYHYRDGYRRKGDGICDLYNGTDLSRQRDTVNYGVN
jgi:hypothetical protein